ncbi:universal stress protein [Yinghuangia soli]|uniref:Universal stress protein n=1 Tax=Yinghuangia soli TaxID=2908204 RepID=A0AA41U541_9ACTN|nr:universal stress protein [Yinghuangia soli]MCF2533595.1 universal stress protein [Yinghuangia soli]
MTGSTTRLPVVVGVERTAAGGLAVSWAADQAYRRGLPLRLVHALDWPAGAPRPGDGTQGDVPQSAVAPRHRESALAHATSWPSRVHPVSVPVPVSPAHGWGERFREAAQVALDEAQALAADLHPGLETAAELVDGTPVEVLRAAGRGASMVVLGSRRRSAIAEMLTTGSIAVPVAAHADCPVAVVRELGHDRAATPTVVVGVDGSEHSQAALEWAFEEAARRGAVLAAVRVVRPISPYTAVPAAMTGRAELAEALAGWKARYPDVTVRTEVAFGHPVRVLADAAAQALCLVVGSRGLGGFKGMLLGSVGNGVLHHAHCPVVVVPTTAGEAGRGADTGAGAGAEAER